MTNANRVRLGMAAVAIGFTALLPNCSADASKGDDDAKFAAIDSAQLTWQNSQEFVTGGRRCATARPLNAQRIEALTDCSMTSTNIKPDYDADQTYEITVVFHVIKKTDGTGNVDPAFLRSQIAILNEDYGAAAGTPGSPGKNAKIQFVLATKDPSGNATPGYEYVTNNSYFTDPGPGASNAMKQALNWDPAHYLNLYTNDSADALGYATFPQENEGYKDGVVLVYSSVGRDSPGGIYNQGRTATHEIGHYLGLFHTFQDGCGSASAPYSSGDLISDTNPSSAPSFNCPVGSLSCGGPAPIRNYMDYSQDTCMNQFSLEQVNRMRCSMQNYRKTLYRVIGSTGGNTAPVASFTSSASGLTASFTDGSTDADGTIASRSWSFGDGSSSTLKDPTHAYTSAGTYSVTLTVTDNDGATATSAKSVTVSGPSGANVLENDVAVTDLGGARAAELRYTFEVPANATNLKFVTSGGTGDADLYVRAGAAPTSALYDVRPYKSGNNETASVASASAGTYYVMVRGYSAFTGVALKASYTP